MVTALLRTATALAGCALVVMPALSAPPSTTLDVLHQDLLAIKASVDALRAVAPAKPSDVVVALRSEEQCSNGAGARVDRKLTTSGSTEPFVIPAGSAFMVTGVALASSMPAGQWARFVLRAEELGIVMGEGTIVNHATVAAPTTGHVAFPSPIRFTTAAPCIALDGSLGNTRTWVYGFLVKDQ
jgi:hypothetical protein